MYKPSSNTGINYQPQLVSLPDFFHQNSIMKVAFDGSADLSQDFVLRLSSCVIVRKCSGRFSTWMSRWKLGSKVRINRVISPTYIWGIGVITHQRSLGNIIFPDIYDIFIFADTPKKLPGKYKNNFWCRHRINKKCQVRVRITSFWQTLMGEKKDYFGSAPRKINTSPKKGQF